MALLGLDVGSTGVKAVVFTTDGLAVAEAFTEYPREDVHSVHGDRIWDAVRLVLSRAAAGGREKISALSISSFGESFVPIGNQGEVLAPTLLYTHPGGTQECAELSRVLGRDFIMRTAGVNPHPMFSLPKLAHLKATSPDVFARARKFLLIEDFVIYRLTGAFAIDHSLASRTMAFDVRGKRFSPELLAACGLSADRFSAPVPSGTPVARIKTDVAAELGLPEGMMIVTGGHDQVCAAVGAGVVSEGVAVDGTGSVGCITPAFSHPILTPDFLEKNYSCVPHAISGLYVTYAFSFTSGALLKWYRDAFCGEARALAASSGESVYDILNRQMPEGPTSLMIVPHFAGSATPDMVGEARGTAYGLSLSTGMAEFYRALMEGAAFEMRYNIEKLKENGVPIREIRAAGGGARSREWLSIKADIYGGGVIPLDVVEAGAAGAAMLAGVATGELSGMEEAARLFVREREPVAPSQHAQAYQAKYIDYLRAREASVRYYTS